MEFDKFENIVYNCDCLDLMREMVNKNIVADWIVTDIPYGISIEKMGYTQGGGYHGNGRAICNDYSKTTDWDSKPLTKEYFDLMFKVSKNQIIFGGNYYSDILPPTKSWIVWDKRCTDTMRNDFSDCELAWCSKGVARVFHYLYNGMLQGDMKNKDKRWHPTQKPTQLLSTLINYYTKENDLIFDPFAGSFSTMVACHKLQRKFLGCELDKTYFDLGSRWLNSVQSQISMFDE